VDALAMVIHGDRELLLGGVLPNHVLIEELLYFQWLGDLVETAADRLSLVVF
jgi:hypothetical protein